MAADIAPDLYEKIKELFEQKYAQAQLFGNSISETLKALEEGTATFRDADLYAGEVGSLLSEALKECISLEDMPGGKFYYNIAQKTVGKALQDEYRLASDIAGRIQEEMNEAAGIGLKAVRPEPNEHRIRNVVDRASRAETQEQLEAALTEPVKTEVRRASDDTQKANAKLHASAGLEVKVEREYDGVGLSGDRDCSWCQDRAGTFTYAEALANGVFERHEGCGCIIEYTSRKGEKTRGRGLVEVNGITGKGWVWEEQERRKIGDQGQEIIDKPTYNKLTKKFVSNGGIIIRGEEAARHLDGRAYAAYVTGANVAFILDDATISDVLEEMFHADQDRKNVFGDLSDREMLLRREIQAQEYLISVESRYKIPISEMKVTRENLKDYRIKLEQYLLSK